MSERFKENDLEEALRKVFVDKRADFIRVDGLSARSRFIRESVSLGLTKGWLYEDKPFDEDNILGGGQGQDYALKYRLTEKGKKYFGISKK